MVWYGTEFLNNWKVIKNGQTSLKLKMNIWHAIKIYETVLKNEKYCFKKSNSQDNKKLIRGISVKDIQRFCSTGTDCSLPSQTLCVPKVRERDCHASRPCFNSRFRRKTWRRNSHNHQTHDQKVKLRQNV